MSGNNSTKDYNDSIRANLPTGMVYNNDRYQVNNHSFFKFKKAGWYYNYVTKYGYSAIPPYAIGGFDPALVFDFPEEFYRTGGSTTTFSNALTHSRLGNATMHDSDGLLKWAPHNLLTYSEDLTQWNANAVTVTANVIEAPDGTFTADKLVTTAAGGSHRVEKSLALTGDFYTLSVYAKASEYGWLQLYSAFTTEYANFDLSSGVVGTVTGSSTSSMTDVGGGWYLCTFNSAFATATKSSL